MVQSDRRSRADQGYALLALLLIMALMIIGAAALAPSLAFEIKRDREEELIHRGVQYSRAIRSFAKKTGHYPVTLEQLRDTGGIRFIRKLYKDPVTGGEFKLLHQGDVISLTTSPNLNPASTQSGDEKPDGTVPPDPSDSSATPVAPGGTGTQVNSNSQPSASSFTSGSNNQVGQVIFGVASRSKAKTIREFDHKNHYKDWLFFYDPARDQGREIKGPTSMSPLAPLQAGSPPLPQAGQSPSPQAPNQTQFGQQQQ